MKIILSFAIGLSFIGVPLNAQTADFSLIKRGEICLYRPYLTQRPFSRVYRATPLFIPLPNNRFFLTETGPRGKQMSYLFSENGELEIIINNSNSKASPPGQLSMINNLFPASDERFGVYDMTKRLTLFETNGDFSESIVLPLTVNSALILSASVYNNTIAVAGIKSDSGNTYAACGILDCSDSQIDTSFYSFGEDNYAEMKKIGTAATAAFHPNVTILSENVFACNISSCPEVRVFRRDGSILIYDTPPPHYKSIILTEPPDSTVPRYTKEGIINEPYEEWFSTWTHSYPPYAYVENEIIVPRILYPDNYLDVYSYSGDELSFLGFAHTDKSFLYADSMGVYLLENSDDTSIIVGVYEIIPPSYRNESGSLWTTMNLSLDELSGIRKVEPDTSDPCGGCDREKRRPRGYETELGNIKLVSVDGGEYSLQDSLTSGCEHVVLFGGIQDCAMHYALIAAERYIEEEQNCNLTIVYTHEYPQEFREFVRLMGTQTEHRILTNIDFEKLEPVVKSSVEFLVINNGGRIVLSSVYPTFQLEPRDSTSTRREEEAE